MIPCSEEIQPRFPVELPGGVGRAQAVKAATSHHSSSVKHRDFAIRGIGIPLGYASGGIRRGRDTEPPIGMDIQLLIDAASCIACR
jgi:translation initiation factor 2 gamma subunit (eIF-2gamma)